MVKKIVTSILCLFLITISIAPITATGDDTDFKENLLEIEQKISLTEEDLDPFIYHTAGPASEKYSQVKLLGGSPEEIQKIEKHLNKSLLSSVFLPYVMVFVSTPLNFTVSYFEEVRDGSRYSYHTYFANATYDDEGNMGDTENETMITNEIHKMKVENFTGVFLYARAKLFRPPTYYIRPLFLPMLFSIIYYNCAKLFFIPARFSFIGSCDNITQLPIFK
jgi:hypothetical protein